MTRRVLACTLLALTAITDHMFAQATAAPQTAAPQTPTPAPTLLPGQTAQSAAALELAKMQGEVLQAEKDRFKAMIDADAKALDHLLAPELRYTHSNAQMQDKPGFMADIRGGAIKYLEIEPADIDVQVFGTMAVVTGTVKMRVLQNGTDTSISFRYTSVQIRQQSGWQLLAWQATRIPQP